jgi:LytS/YehU family sensor histidine kinase
MEPPFRVPPFRPGLALGLVNLAFGIAFGWVHAAKEATEARERTTAELLRQSQARALQNQLNPHVLYNALNGLAELVHEDPLAAEEMVAKLADLYRMLTVHGEGGLVRLAEERRLVEAYLDMEQMRLGDRLQVQWHWPPWADRLALPPFFLLPLVENAVKHGISPAEQGGQVVVSCARRGAMVQLLVENSGCPLREGHRGVGLGNLEARLGLWTELSGSFNLEARGPWTAATVQWLPEGPWEQAD